MQNAVHARASEATNLVTLFRTETQMRLDDQKNGAIF